MPNYIPNYNRSALDDLEQRKFMSKLRAELLKRVEQGGQTQDYSQGPTSGQVGMSSSAPSSSESFDAMTRRRIANAQYGVYGQPGIAHKIVENEQNKAIAEARKNQLKDSLAERKIKIEEGTLAEKIRANKAKEAKGGDDDLGLGEGSKPTAPPASGRPKPTTATPVAPQAAGATPGQETKPTAASPGAAAQQPKYAGTMTISQRALDNMGKPYMPSQEPGYKYTLADQDSDLKEGDIYGNKYTGFHPRKVGKRYEPPAPVPEGPMHTINIPQEHDPYFGQKVRQQLADGTSLRNTAAAGGMAPEAVSRMDPDAFAGMTQGPATQKPRQKSRMDPGAFKGYPEDTAEVEKARQTVTQPASVDLRKGLGMLRPGLNEDILNMIPSLKPTEAYAPNPQPLTEAMKLLPRNKKMDKQLQSFLKWMSERGYYGAGMLGDKDIWE